MAGPYRPQDAGRNLIVTGVNGSGMAGVFASHTGKPGREDILRNSPQARHGQRPASPYNLSVKWQDHISVNPTIRNGKPCVTGTRITVYDVLEYLAGGMSESQILEDFPDLTREKIRACLAFAAERERRVSNSVA